MTLLGIVCAAIVIFLLGRWLFGRLEILDKPGKDVPKRKRVPTLMGLVLVFGFFAIGSIFYPQYFVFSASNPFLGMYIGGLLIVLVSLIDELGSLWDNRLRVSPKVRLLTHVAAALVAYSVSGVAITEFTLPGGTALTFGIFGSVVLTIGRYLMFTNAINRFDGIYGLATGMSSIGFFTIALLLYVVVLPAYPDMTPERFVLLQGVYRMAMLLGVLSAVAAWFERKPLALVRDVGTMFLGFCLGYIGLVGGAKIGMMVVVLALPLFDALWVIIDRLHRRKKHPFHGDYSHIHYRLMALGRNRHEVRVTLRGGAILLLIIMLLLGAQRIDKVILFVLVAVVFYGVNVYVYRWKGLPTEYDPKTQVSLVVHKKKKNKKKKN